MSLSTSPPRNLARDLADTQECSPVHFKTYFEGQMDMFAPCSEVDAYLQAHQGWFCRCAQPMQVEPSGEHGYILTVGRFGALGFEVEPKISVMLEPPSNGRYFMHTVPLPETTTLGYEVDYAATMLLAETDATDVAPKIRKEFEKVGKSLPTRITQVQWNLEMDVAVQFPRYIYKLPRKLIQSTGDRLLTEIVRQVSPRLTLKVQQDFHRAREFPIPPKSSRYFQRIVPNAQSHNAAEVMPLADSTFS